MRNGRGWTPVMICSVAALFLASDASVLKAETSSPVTVQSRRAADAGILHAGASSPAILHGERTPIAVSGARDLLPPIGAHPGSARLPAPPDAPVADAAMRGDIEAVRRLLQAGADVNAAQGDGMTALHWAALEGDVELTRMLIYAGANVRVGTRIGDYTPLHLASRSGSAEVIRLLLQAGSNVQARTTNSGAVPLHLAAASGNVAAVEMLLDHGAYVNVREEAWRQTPLIFAAANGRADVVRVLLERGADPALTAQAVDVPRRAAADSAAQERMKAVLASFCQDVGGGSKWQPTPYQVQVAVQELRRVQREWLNGEEDTQADEEQAAPEEAEDEEQDAQGCEEESAPEEEQEDVQRCDEQAPAGEEQEDAQACEEEDGRTGEEEGAPAGEEEGDTEKAKEKEGPRPLSYAELVGRWGGLTPLLHAARQGHVDAALALLDGGADVNQVSAGDHTSPLLIAAINGQFDLALVLLEHGADPNLASAAGTTPLYAVLERQWAPRASYAHPTEHRRQKATYLEVMKALLEAGAKPNVRLKKHLWYMQYTFDVLRLKTVGATPFWRAAYALDVDAMKLLVAYGADPNIATKKPPERRRRGDDEEDEDHSGLPPVPVGGPAIWPIHAASGVGYGTGFAATAHQHVPGGWMPAIRYLVETCGADVNARDADGYTPLHHAASRGDNEMVLYLVEHGADVTAVSREGQTTADMANGPVQRIPPFPETVELLESLGSKNNHNCQSC